MGRNITETMDIVPELIEMIRIIHIDAFFQLPFNILNYRINTNV